MKRLFIRLFAVLILGSAPALSAGDMSAHATFSFADQLFSERDYFRAITEYERFLFLYPDNSRAKEARFQIAVSYFLGEKLDEAIRLFGEFAEKYPDDNLARHAELRIGEAHFRKKDYPRAIARYESLLQAHPNAPEADSARIQIGWCRLQQGDWTGAIAQFETVPAASPLREQAQWLAAEATAYPAVSSKSPALAGTLSAVVPGAGQLYLGRKFDALLSFLMNGVFIWATVEALENHSHATAGVLLFFESGWYFGNVYSAVSGAHKYNRDRKLEHLDRMSNQYGFSLYRDEKQTSVLAFTMRF